MMNSIISALCVSLSPTSSSPTGVIPPRKSLPTAMYCICYPLSVITVLCLSMSFNFYCKNHITKESVTEGEEARFWRGKDKMGNDCSLLF